MVRVSRSSKPMVEVHRGLEPPVCGSAEVAETPKLRKNHSNFTRVRQTRMCTGDREDVWDLGILGAFTFVKDPRYEIPSWVMPLYVKIHEMSITLIR